MFNIATPAGTPFQ